MPMSPVLAQAIAEWLNDGKDGDVQYFSGKDPQRHLRRIATHHTLVLDHFCRRYGRSAVQVTRAGIGIPLPLAAAEVEQALQVLALPQSERENGHDVFDRLRCRMQAQAQATAKAVTAAEAVASVAVSSTPPMQRLRLDDLFAEPMPPDGQRWQVVCDLSAAEQALAETKDKSPERLRVLQHLVNTPEKWLPGTADHHLQAIRALIHDFPNFRPAIDAIARHLSLLKRTGAALRLPPLLLLGPPGVGKTEFARRVAEVLGLHLAARSLADVTASWLITGSARKWSEAAPGVVARVIAECHSGEAPMLLLDELDKASGEHRSYPCDTALLGVLEPSTARHFRDENLDLELDASPVSYLLTANRRDKIRPELLSRLKVVEIPLPTQEQVPAVVRSIDRMLRRESPDLAVSFAPLEDALIEALSVQPPRELRRLLLELYARVSERSEGESETEQGRLHVQKADLDAVTGRVEKPMKTTAVYIIPLWVDPGSTRVH